MILTFVSCKMSGIEVAKVSLKLAALNTFCEFVGPASSLPWSLSASVTRLLELKLPKFVKY